MSPDGCALILVRDFSELSNSISGLVVEYIVAIDVTRIRFPADALLLWYVNVTFCLAARSVFVTC